MSSPSLFIPLWPKRIVGLSLKIVPVPPFLSQILPNMLCADSLKLSLACFAILCMAAPTDGKSCRRLFRQRPTCCLLLDEEVARNHCQARRPNGDRCLCHESCQQQGNCCSDFSAICPHPGKSGLEHHSQVGRVSVCVCVYSDKLLDHLRVNSTECRLLFLLLKTEVCFLLGCLRLDNQSE